MQSAEYCVVLRVQGHPVAAAAPGTRADFSKLEREFPWVAIETPAQSSAGVRVDVDAWREPSLDVWAFDRAMDRAAETKELTIAVVGSADDLPDVSLEVLTRCQRLIRRRNDASATPLFEAVLDRHRALHDLGRPLVCADFDHALDVWQWLLRLAPEASLEAQLAALFHDIERLVSEPDRRIEQHAADYLAYKQRHAARGADLAAGVLGEAGVPDAVVRGVMRLIAEHERPPQHDDRDLALINDADALSFFSLNSVGFINYYGLAHTRKKVAHSLHRLRARARGYLDHVRLRPEVRALIEELERSPV